MSRAEIYVESQGDRRTRIGATAVGLGAIFGAISGVFVPVISGAIYTVGKGDSIKQSFDAVGLILFAPITASVGLFVGAVLGLVIGVVVACSRVPVRAVVFVVTFVPTVALGIASISTVSTVPVMARFLTFCFVPGVFAIGLGQFGARWLIPAVER